MGLRLTKPGLSAMDRSPFRGFDALGFTSDDENDPAFTGGGGGGSSRPRGKTEEDDDSDDEDDDSDEDEDEDENDQKSKKSTKSKKDEDDEEDSRPHRQAARYRVKLREAQRHNAELEERLRKIEDSDKPQDELLKRDLAEVRDHNERLTDTNRVLTSQLAFFKSNTVDWIDPNDAFGLADREGLFDDLIDEDGTVDQRQLGRALRDLAKRKPHLVKKSTTRGQDSKDDDDERSSRSSASTMNGSRRGKQKTGSDRASLAKRFPVLGR